MQDRLVDDKTRDRFHYKKLLQDDLAVTERIFSETHHRETIAKLQSAYDAMRGTVGDYYGISLCSHIASSLLLAETTPDNLSRTVRLIERNKQQKKTASPFDKIDPTVVMVSATLYYLLTEKHPKNPLTQKTDVAEYIHSRFDQMNWMIGEKGMAALALERLVTA